MDGPSSHIRPAGKNDSLPCSVPSAGCFFGDEVKGNSESAPSDTDTTSEAERSGPEHSAPQEPLDSSRDHKDNSALGPETEGTAECILENTCPDVEGKEAAQASVTSEHPNLASAPAELPWTNIDLKEPRKVPSHSAAGFAETVGLSSLGLFPLGLDEPFGADDHPLWAWVSGGGCAVEAGSALKWFTVQSGKGPCRARCPQRWSCGTWGMT